MSRKERHRLVILGQVRDGYKSLKLAAKQMQLCYRQAKRVWQQFREHGEAGLVHRGRGQDLQPKDCGSAPGSDFESLS